MRISCLRIALAFLLGGLTTSASAHEYYLQPDAYSVETGEEFGIAHKNGMRFKGNAYPWITQWNVRSEAWQNGQGVKVFGKDGDRPALKLKSTVPGLVAIIHESAPSTLNFSNWDKFRSYLADEGLEHIAAEHEKRGLPKDKIKEVYTRFAKTLINVGKTEQSDGSTRLKIELIALKNPALLQRGDPLPVQVLWKGKPLAGVMVKVFAGTDTEAVHRIDTDANGMALIPDAGAAEYLLNAVHMTVPTSQDESAKDADWESFWASLTLKRD